MADPLPIPEVAAPRYQLALQKLWDQPAERIALKLRGDPAVAGLDVRQLAEQVAQRRAALAKVPAWAAVEGLVWPLALAVEQASSEATACYKRRLLGPLLAESVLIDFTAGMGVDAWALGGMLRHARLYEQQAQLAAVTHHNLRKLLPDRSIDVWAQAAPVGAVLDQPAAPQIWFFDPARRSDSGARLRDFADCTPDVLAHLAAVPDAVLRILIKAAPMLDLSLAIEQLEAAGSLRVTEVHIVARAGVCREVVYLLQRPQPGWQPLDRQFHAVDLQEARSLLWTQTERDGQLPVPVGAVDAYLFDPHAALRKLRLLGPLCQHFGLRQVATNTLLLTGPVAVDGFPGRMFRVLDGPLKKPARALPGRAASIVTRNFPEPAPTLRRRWKLKESERQFLLAFRDHSQRAVIWHAERVPA
ncbi:MAG: hypothetical protein AAGG11_18890 [Pseudomonadota bacterium]